MTLSEYMKLHSLSDADFAASLGCSEGAVKKWRYRERIPRPDQMRQISDATGGDVTANDFMSAAESPSYSRPRPLSAAE